MISLKKGSEHLLQERLIRYLFILKNVDTYRVEKMYKCMRVSKKTYYHWLKNKDKIIKESPTTLLKERIKFLFKDSIEIYGSCRIRKMLEREGLFYTRSYVGLLMKEMGLRSVLKRKYAVTTDSNHQYLITNNELNRNFSSQKLGEKWGSDIT